MPIDIRPLTAELAEDFLRYFDDVAFCDHDEWAGCYCMEGHRACTDDLLSFFGEPNRTCARELILSGKMRGYLAYDGDEVIGWCNADDKRNYRYLTTNLACWPPSDAALRIMTMYCLTIAPARRGQGVGTALIQRVITDASAQGYDVVEAYPWKDEKADFPYHGTVRLLERLGFRRTGDFWDQYIYQRKL